MTKTQIFVADAQWLGVGRVRCGLEYNGILYWCHVFDNTNVLDKVYTTTMNLPIHYSIRDGANSVVRQTLNYMRYRPGKSINMIMTFNMYGKVAGTLDQICATVLTETSNDQETSYQHAVSRGITPKTITTTRGALLSIRPKLLFNGLPNRTFMLLETIELMVSGTGTILWQVVYNPTLGGTPSWTDPGVSAPFEFDIAGTTVTGGVVVSNGYTSSSTQVKNAVTADVGNKFPLTLDIAGNVQKIMTICATATTGNADVLASILVKSLY